MYDQRTRDRMERAADKAREILDQAADEGRDLTDPARAHVDARLKSIRNLREQADVNRRIHGHFAGKPL